MHFELALNYEIVQWSLDFVYLYLLYFGTLHIKLDLLISIKFVLVKVIKLDLHVNYYFKIIDLGCVCFFHLMLEMANVSVSVDFRPDPIRSNSRKIR